MGSIVAAFRRKSERFAGNFLAVRRSTDHWRENGFSKKAEIDLLLYAAL
jgi:hypothetical protein